MTAEKRRVTPKKAFGYLTLYLVMRTEDGAVRTAKCSIDFSRPEELPAFVNERFPELCIKFYEENTGKHITDCWYVDKDEYDLISTNTNPAGKVSLDFVRDDDGTYRDTMRFIDKQGRETVVSQTEGTA